MEFVNGKDDIPYMKWKIKAMFETTNQQVDRILAAWYDVDMDLCQLTSHWPITKKAALDFLAQGSPE